MVRVASFTQAGFSWLRSSMGLSWLLDNPLLTREIRRRMRNKLLSWSLILYLVALGVVSSLIMLATYPMELGQVSLRDRIQTIGAIGRNIFIGMCVVESLIALLVAPMVSAGLAVQEKEQSTFEFLRVTTLRARTFVVGCLLTTALFLLLVFSCSLPILGLTFIFGGVSMAEILMVHYMLFMAAMAFCAWGIFVSTAQTRARGMQILSMVALFILFLFFWSSGLFGIMGLGFTSVPSLLLGGGVLGGLTVLLAIAAMRRLYDPQNRLFNYRQYTVLFLAVLAGPAVWLSWSGAAQRPGADLEFWVYAVLLGGWVMLVLAIVLFSAGRFERGDEVWQIRMRWPLFQRLDERLALYAVYIAMWLGAVAMTHARWGTGTGIGKDLSAILALLLASLLPVWALCRLLSFLVADRNKAVAAALALLAVVWLALPVVAEVFEEIGGGTSMAADFLRLFSPLGGLDWDRQVVATAATQVILALLLLAPTLGASARARLRVTYSWTLGAEESRAVDDAA